MKPSTKAPKAPKEPKTQPDAKDDLKTLPLPEVQKRLKSSPDGLQKAEAKSA